MNHLVWTNKNLVNSAPFSVGLHSIVDSFIWFELFGCRYASVRGSGIYFKLYKPIHCDHADGSADWMIIAFAVSLSFFNGWS